MTPTLLPKPAAERQWLSMSGARSRFTFGLGLGLWTVLTYFLVVQSLRNEDPFVFVQRSPHVYRVLDAGSLELEVSSPLRLACASPEGCLAAIAGTPRQALRIFQDQPPHLGSSFQDKQELRYLQVHFVLHPDHFKTPYTGVSAAVHFPRFRFQQADLFFGGSRERRFFSGERLLSSLNAAHLEQEAVQGDLLLTVDSDDADALCNWGEPAFLTDMVGRDDYVDFSRMRENHPVRQINSLIRVSMSVFALLLFLIVESSNEALGLALLMGFDALAMLFGYADLRHTWMPATVNLTFFEYFFTAMTDVCRLFFFLHLARVRRPAAGPWLGWGLVYAVPYATLLFLTLDSGWTWQRYLVGGGQAVVAATGLILCVRSAFKLGSVKVPWRMGALVLAATAAGCQLLDVVWNYPGELGAALALPPLLGKIINIVETNSSYLLALSTFVNISTLENRVRSLSAEKAKAQEIERELELGRSVQRAFMTLPALPACLSVESYHEAALYVSGDTYYTHWQEDKSRFVCLLNDVTGHGVQAALKAFGCTVIARSVWKGLKDGQIDGDRRLAERLSRYDNAITELVNNEGEARDFNAMVGVEFNTATGEAKLYRVNYNHPLVIELTAEGGWVARQLAIPNQVVVTHQLAARSMIILMSDGILAHPRDQRSLFRSLDETMAAAGTALDAATVKKAVIAWANSRAVRIVDDRTFLVFQWNPDAATSRQAA